MHRVKRGTTMAHVASDPLVIYIDMDDPTGTGYTLGSSTRGHLDKLSFSGFFMYGDKLKKN